MMSLTSTWRQVSRGLHGLFNDADKARELDDELQHYLQQAIETRMRAGMSATEARRAAQAEVGNLTVNRETVRMSLWESTVSSTYTDVRYAVRMLRRSPVFTVVVVLVISLGVGAVTTIFSAANAFLLKPLPGAASPEALVSIDRAEPGGRGRTQSSYPFYRYIREHTRTMSGVAAWGKTDLTITPARDVGQSVYGNLVSGNFFAVLGTRPALGRFFLPEEDETPLTHPVIVVSYEFWRSALGGDSSVVGKPIGVNGTAFTLIGIAPPGFRGVFTPIVTSAWVPLMMLPRIRPKGSLTAESSGWLWMFGRMKDGVSREAARQDLRALTAARITDGDEPEWMKRNNEIRLIGLNGLPEDARSVMFAFTGVLLGVAFLVLVIASVNVAAMLSARALARTHEMAIRVALGAARSRLVRQMLTESGVLFAFGALGGVLLAVLGTSALEHIPLPGGVPLSLELAPDGRVFVFALGVSLVTGVVFGLAPALQVARDDISSRLRADAKMVDARKGLVRNALVVGQLALSLVLLVLAGLLFRALDSGRNVDPRFQIDGVVTAMMKSEAWGYDEAHARSFFRLLRNRVAEVPGVTEVSYTERLPLQMSSSNDDVILDGAAAGKDGKPEGTSVQTEMVDAKYFSVLGIPLRDGRAIQASDDEHSARIAVVNETFAKTHFSGGSAVGRGFTYHGERVTVVGVARDAKYATLTEQTPAVAYFPTEQEWRSDHALLVRTNLNALAASEAIAGIVRSLDPALPRPEVVSLREATKSVLLPQQVAAGVTGTLGLLGLLLAIVGLYGIISYSVGRRSREIGIVMALGARAEDVERMVVRGGMRLAGIGVCLGLVLASAASRLLVSYLYGVSPLDVPTFAATSALFMSIALVASYLPARRAARSDPMVVLRAE